MMLFVKFYKVTGVRNATRLKLPPVSLLKNLTFPRNSYLHFTEKNEDGSLTLGIREDNIFLVNRPTQSRVVIQHQLTYSDKIDITAFNAVRHTLQKPLLVKEYHREHPTFVKGFIDRTKSLIQTNIVVKNHTLVGADYSYVKNVLSEYNKLSNYWISIMDDISKTILLDTRHHFLPIQLPDIIPSRSQLAKWETGTHQANWRKIGTQERYLFAEFYSWLRQEGGSIFPMEDKVLERLNIVFYHKYFYFTVNMGMLKNWIIPAVGKTADTQTTSVSDVRKNFILGAIKLVMNTVVADEGDQTIDQGEDNEDTEAGDLCAAGAGDVNGEILSTDDPQTETDDLTGINEKDRIKLNPLNADNNVGISSIAELMKMGLEREVKGKVGKLKEAVEIFNSETTEEADDEDALDALEVINTDQERHEEKIEILKEVGYKPYQHIDLDLSSIIDEKTEVMVREGKFTTSEIKRLKTLGRRWETIKDPKGSGKLAPELINILPTELMIDKEVKVSPKKVNGVLDDTMLNSSIHTLSKRYDKEILHRHIMASGINLQRNGVCVTDYNVKTFENAFDAYEIHSFKFIPLEGQESTANIRLPLIQKNGTFISGGVTSRMRMQRVDLPIRKIAHNRVALASYVSKFFVGRSELSAYSQERWLEKQLIQLSNDNPKIKVNFADCYKYDTVAPVKFTILSRLVSKIETDEYTLNFDVTKQSTLFGAELIKAFADSSKNQIVFGKSKKKNTILIMSEDSSVFECSTENVKDIKSFGTIESFLGFDLSKSPLDMLDVSISGKVLPFVFVMSYYLGLGNLLKTIGAKFERHPKGVRLALDDQQFAVKFSDETLVFDRRDYKTMIIVGGLKQIKDLIKNYSVYEFDLKDVYGAILLDLKITARYTKELDLMHDLWVDPITRDTLREMGEPTDFIGLLLRAADMLLIDEHQMFRDEIGFRMRGNERFAGFAYREMVLAVRAHNNKPSKANSRIEINPFSAWMKILQDQTTAPVEDSNPIHSLKETEVVVYRGQGGRDARSLNSESRKYHVNSVGILSDGTVDNGDAGTVVYLSANPNFKSLMGTTHVTKAEQRKDLSATELLTTSSLLSPFIDQDD